MIWFKYVIDGGALLHKISWGKNEPYSTILLRYFTYVDLRYPKATIVFDGYESPLSTKDTAHQRRSRTVGREVLFSEEMILTTKKEEFLSNKANKSRFIKMLATYLANRCVHVIQAKDDADVLIVQTAVDFSRSQNVVVIGDDTDLLVLLIYHVNENSQSVYLKNEGKKGQPGKLWDIKDIRGKLGIDFCRRILFAHAILGCDTTSRLFGLGKGLAIKTLGSNDNDFNEAADTFLRIGASKEEIDAAGQKAVVILYGCDKSATLNANRYHTFKRKVANSTMFVHPKDLPPTASACKFHSFRVYYQVQMWSDSNASQYLSPEDWGWVVRDGVLHPICTDIAPAPENILKVIKCGCKGSCSSMRCTCRKNGVECSSVCNGCKGINCLNASSVIEEDNFDLDNVE